MATTKKTTKKQTKKEEEVKEVKEELTEEELKKEFFDNKEDKESVFIKILNVLLWIILFAWMAICLFDFYKTRRREKPMFTFKHEVVKYEDGQVDSYLGLGYKIYNYQRKCINGIEYGPFWSEDRSITDENCSK